MITPVISTVIREGFDDFQKSLGGGNTGLPA